MLKSHPPGGFCQLGVDRAACVTRGNSVWFRIKNGKERWEEEHTKKAKIYKRIRDQKNLNRFQRWSSWLYELKCGSWF